MIPIITGTSCPSSEELRSSFAIVVTHRFPGSMGPATLGYLGRISNEEGPRGLVRLDDAFDYQCIPQVTGTKSAPRLAHVMTIKPCDGFDLLAIAVAPLAIILLAHVGVRLVDEIRNELVSAWNGREHLRKASSSVHVADESTRISAP